MISTEVPLIELSGLSKRFGNLDAVKDVNIEVHAGEIFSLLGPNGSGKTTTIRMMMGILQPVAGTARIMGLDCFRDRAEVMKYVGFLPDNPIFYDYLRGREIIYFVGEMRGMSNREIAGKTIPLAEKLDLEEALEDYAVNYSRGMKKKLALICALLHEPHLLILDEPTSGLDPIATRVVRSLLIELVEKGASIFFSTHLLDQAQKLCDRVGILYKGNLVAKGDLRELQEETNAGSSLEEIFFSVMSEQESNGGNEVLTE